MQIRCNNKKKAEAGEGEWQRICSSKSGYLHYIEKKENLYYNEKKERAPAAQKRDEMLYK